jgi:signal transduction histidine kinase
MRRLLVKELLATVLVCWLACTASLPASAQTLEPRTLRVLLSDASTPPGDDDAGWQTATTPDSRTAPVAWYRVAFEMAQASPGDPWMLYLPYFYGGGRIWLNNEPVAGVLESTAATHVRWGRPVLLPLPASALHVGGNVLHIRAVATRAPSSLKLPRLVLGPQQQLQALFDRRLFFVRTVPLVTVVSGVVVGLFVMFIWLRRPQEVLYGLFGLAALLWGLRTMTFVFDVMPAALWPFWRLIYHTTTGGFIIVLALFAMNLAGWWRPRVAASLAAYGLLGPLLYLVAGAAAEGVVGRWWALGLAPIGVSVAVLSFVAAWQQRNLGTVLIATAVALAVAAGVHDYLLNWSSSLLNALSPEWPVHRIFLLHHAANLLLVVMGVLLTTRFIQTLHEVETANQTLEARVAEREQQVVTIYQKITQLQREQAAQEERQRIMQELHDGLGSQLFVSLLLVERGALQAPALAEVLRGAIDEMRVAIEALASDDHDFRIAFGNFRFRWEQRLRDAGLASDWDVVLPDKPLGLLPHDALQLLRVAQEALTNVVKHAQAQHVRVALGTEGDALTLVVADDGTACCTAPHEGGRGLSNMRARASRAGAQLQVQLATAKAPGTRITLRLPLRGGAASAH